MSSDLRPMVSMVKCATDKETCDISVEKVFEAIRTGGKNLKGQIQQIRNRFETELAFTNDRKKAKLAVDPLKKQLPGVMWSGTFSARANDKLMKHSGRLCADLDSLGAQLVEVRKKLEASPHALAVFLSPSGDGLKVIFRVAADASRHAGSFGAVEKHVRDLTGTQVDQACKDPARLCFMSHDPQLYINPAATQIEPLLETVKPKRPHSTGEIDLLIREGIAGSKVGAMERAGAGKPAGSYYCTCPFQDLHTTGNGPHDTMVYLLPNDQCEAPTIYCVHNSCRAGLGSLNHELRSEISRTEFHARKDAEPITGLKTVKYQPTGNELNELSPLKTDLTSFNSSPEDYEIDVDAEIDDFPEPLGNDAFHGLAGDIVRRIEPHTEADPAALLVQTLTAFGSVLGRGAYAIADGSFHHTNLNVVIVGETSKARKGTSEAHTRRIFKRADEVWATRCIVHGLSSGEGLIWAVRDPITKAVKDKKSGDYETEIVDGGVDDKRLMVVEGEFANVLKVMAREGNTLSPIIRSAWDDGNLRSITKNSPARATGAQVSIIGHITQNELRRGLSETESGNGFANRFLFVAARRSKCLPEGGSIERENLNDLVTRLHDAIEFARTAGEVTRDEESRELWRICYPALSEGKPGLLGAITARAEAQVLRLSCLYALLDRSIKINVEHHRAALALWNYCDRSASWIFGTATGDPNADKISIALRVAGNKGMTQTEISERVFKRNVSSNALCSALRILLQSGQANFKKESTSGAPRKRWFAALSTSIQFPISRGKTTNSVDVDVPSTEKIAAPPGVGIAAL